MILFVIFLFILGLIGVIVFKRQFYSWKMYSKILGSKNQSIYDNKQGVPIEGEVKPHPNQEPFRKPFSNEPCVYEDWSITHSYPIYTMNLIASDTYGNEHSVSFMIKKDGQVIEVPLDQIQTIKKLTWTEIPNEPELRVDVEKELDEKGLLQLSEETYISIGLDDEVTVFGNLEKVDDSTEIDYRLTKLDRNLIDMGKDLLKFSKNPFCSITDYNKISLKRSKYRSIMKMGIAAFYTATCFVLILSWITNDVTIIEKMASYMTLGTISMIILYPILSIIEFITYSVISDLF